MNRKNDGESILRRMFHRCVFQNYLGAMTLMINTAADGMIISHFLGSQATAAFGLVFPIYSLISFFPSLLRTAAQVNLGKYIGRGNLDRANRCVFYLLVSGFAAALPFLLLLTALRGHTLTVLCVHAHYPETILALASDYLFWLAPAVIPLMLCSVLHPIMQMDGDAGRSPRAIQIAAVVNLGGDMMNVLLFHGGMVGMAQITTLSCYCELFVLLLHFRSQRANLRPSAGGGLPPNSWCCSRKEFLRCCGRCPLFSAGFSSTGLLSTSAGKTPWLSLPSAAPSGCFFFRLRPP